MREKYHPALRALAIRDKKIYTVGPLENIPEGVRVYLDVEGMPDQDLYYLIGLRIVHRRKSVQHCLWAEHAADERIIWSQFITIIDNLPNPQLIHYGSYETLFLRRMCERYGRPVGMKQLSSETFGRLPSSPDTKMHSFPTIKTIAVHWK